MFIQENEEDSKRVLKVERVGVVDWVAAEGVEGGGYAGKILRRNHQQALEMSWG